jgi:hypothetical protein
MGRKRKQTKNQKKPLLDKDTALRLAWERGLLSFLLYDYQIPLYESLWGAIKNPKCLKYVLNCSRRYGKSTIMCLIALEFAIRNPNSQIRFAAPTGKALKKITNPIFRMLLETCPKHLKPRYYTQDQEWKFFNGSIIACAGTDNGHAENLRGTTSHLNLIDEAGFCDDLNYVINSILIPQTLTTGGKTLLASTPPKTPAHDFVSIAQECEAQGFYKIFTIFDNKTLSKETVDLYAKEAGGYNSSTFKREYLCKFVTDETLSVIPEWKDEYIQIPDKTNKFDKYYHRYVALDIGVIDKTAVIFGHYNFKEGILYIEDEITLQGNEVTTERLTKEIKDKEKQVFGDLQPYKRIADNNNLILLQDLSSMHNLHFSPTNKETLDAMVNETRLMIGGGRIRVHPRCTHLIGCLKYAIWDKNHKGFARSSVYGHFDGLAALIYLVRNLDQHTNPIPPEEFVSPYTHYIPENKQENKQTEIIRKIFRVNK